MDDKRLDELIAGTLPSAPPDDVAGAVTPWRRAMCQVLWGFGLGAVTFNFYGLNYILPAIGTLLMLCGFRTLRRENAFFMACYVVGIVRMLAAIARLVVNSTVYAYDERVLEFWQNLAWPGVIMHLVLVLLLWNALSAVQRRAGQMPHAGAVLWLFVWNLVVAVLALIGAQFGMLFGIALLAAYALIIRSLYKLYCELDGLGYVIKATPGRVSNRALTITLIAVTLALMACGYVFFSKYPMDWLPAETSGESETRAELAELGFPEEVLADISDADVARCAGATQVHCTKNEYGAVDVTMVAVQMPRDPLHWLTFHYFEIDDGLDFSTTEGIRLNSSYAMSSRDYYWIKDGEPTGMVLYDAEDATLSAPMARIRAGTRTTSIMFGTYYNPVTYAEFSLPDGAENVRGYVVHDMRNQKSLSGGLMIDSYFELYHRCGSITFPSKTAIDLYLYGGRADQSERLFSDYLDIYLDEWPG